MNNITHIFTCAKLGELLTAHTKIEAVERSGLVGDRWYRANNQIAVSLRHLNALRRGKPFVSKDISIITTAQLAEGNANLFKLAPDTEPFTAEEMRRNLVIEGDFDLNALAPDKCCSLDYDSDGFCDVHKRCEPVGRKFTIGNVKLIGTMWCAPCKIPAARAGKLKGREQLFKDAFALCGGLRAKILTSGLIQLGDQLGGVEARP